MPETVSIMRQTRQRLKPTLWQRFKVWRGTANESEREKVAAYKLLRRGIREKTVAQTDERTQNALQFLSSNHVAHFERQEITKHLLSHLVKSGQLTQEHVNHIVSDQNQEKLKQIFSSTHLHNALKEASETRKNLFPMLFARRASTLLTHQNLNIRNALASGLMRAAEEHGLAALSQQPPAATQGDHAEHQPPQPPEPRNPPGHDNPNPPNPSGGGHVYNFNEGSHPKIVVSPKINGGNSGNIFDVKQAKEQMLLQQVGQASRTGKIITVNPSQPKPREKKYSLQEIELMQKAVGANGKQPPNILNIVSAIANAGKTSKPSTKTSAKKAA